MEYDKILAILSCQYPISFTHLEIFRNCGSTSYIVHSKRHKYFLKISKPAFGDTIRSSVCVNVFLQNNNFPVPNVVFTVAGLPYVEIETEIGLRYYICMTILRVLKLMLNMMRRKLVFGLVDCIRL